MFHIVNEPVIEWSSSSVVHKGRSNSYLKLRKLVSKGCIYHLVRVNDSSAEVPPLKTYLIVNEFLKVFSDDLPRVPPEREIDFSINFIRVTGPISILPYRMAPQE